MLLESGMESRLSAFEETKKAIKSTALDSSFSIFIISSVAAFGLDQLIDSISLWTSIEIHRKVQ